MEKFYAMPAWVGGRGYIRVIYCQDCFYGIREDSDIYKAWLQANERQMIY